MALPCTESCGYENMNQYWDNYMQAWIDTHMAVWQLRIEVGERLVQWGVVTRDENIAIGDGSSEDPVYTHLAWLLDYADGTEMMDDFRDEDVPKLRLLLGPHGLTIYRIMVLRRTS